jgi:hypothetical protein
LSKKSCLPSATFSGVIALSAGTLSSGSGSGVGASGAADGIGGSGGALVVGAVAVAIAAAIWFVSRRNPVTAGNVTQPAAVEAVAPVAPPRDATPAGLAA